MSSRVALLYESSRMGEGAEDVHAALGLSSASWSGSARPLWMRAARRDSTHGAVAAPGCPAYRARPRSEKGPMIDVVMPQLGESVVEGTVTRWLVREGEQVKRDQVLLEVATDKADTEVRSPADGLVASIAAAAGAVVPTRALLARIDETATAKAPAPAPAPVPVPVPAPAPAPAPPADAEPAALPLT